MLPFNVPSNDCKPLIINNFIQNVWQQSWSDQANQNNKLYNIKPRCWRMATGIGDKSPRRNYIGPSSHLSFIYHALQPFERKRRVSMDILQCTFNYTDVQKKRPILFDVWFFSIHDLEVQKLIFICKFEHFLFKKMIVKKLSNCYSFKKT